MKKPTVAIKQAKAVNARHPPGDARDLADPVEASASNDDVHSLFFVGKGRYSRSTLSDDDKRAEIEGHSRECVIAGNIGVMEHSLCPRNKGIV